MPLLLAMSSIKIPFLLVSSLNYPLSFMGLYYLVKSEQAFCSPFVEEGTEPRDLPKILNLQEMKHLVHFVMAHKLILGGIPKVIFYLTSYVFCCHV